MEQEMKYAIPGKDVAEAIWQDDWLAKLADPATQEALVMKAVYFDTKDRALTRRNMTVRVRSEGGRNVATLKWGGCVENGFHERNEVNVPVTGDISFIQPSASMFAESEDGAKLMELVEGQPLLNLLETRFLRRRIRLDYKGDLIELSIDEGSVITDKGEAPISELELELFVGDPSSIKELGDRLAMKYDLRPKDSSKFADGMALLDRKSA